MFEPGAPVSLFATRLSYATASGLPKSNYAVAPDGQKFLMNIVAQESSTSSITIMLNWTAALKK